MPQTSEFDLDGEVDHPDYDDCSPNNMLKFTEFEDLSAEELAEAQQLLIFA
jgi:hypothetical protein